MVHLYGQINHLQLEEIPFLEHILNPVPLWHMLTCEIILYINEPSA